MIEKAGVACCPVMTAQQVWNDEEYNRLGWFVNYPMYPEWEGNEDVASNKHCPFFADFSAFPNSERMAFPARHVGEDNMDVLTEWGLSEDEAKALLKQWGAANV